MSIPIAGLCLQSHRRKSLNQLLKPRNRSSFACESLSIASSPRYPAILTRVCKPVADHVVDVHVRLESLTLRHGCDIARSRAFNRP